MTDKLIEQIKADREAGTPGPWKVVKEGQKWLWIGPYGWFTRVCRVVLYDGQSEMQEANARRIARVPDMEARILADADRIEALEALVEALTAEVEKADKMERAFIKVKKVDRLIDALPATMHKHARAAFAEQEKDDE